MVPSIKSYQIYGSKIIQVITKNHPSHHQVSKHLLAEIRRQGPVLLEILGSHQAISVDALALVDPQQHHLAPWPSKSNSNWGEVDGFMGNITGI